MIEINLSQKQVLITGASRGIGAATAHQFARAGASLYLNGRDETALTALSQELQETYGTNCHVLAFDVAKPEAVKTGFQQLFKHTKTLDVLINNAGVLQDALLGMITPTQIEQTFSVNAYSVLYCSQYAARMMQRAGGGSIINIASIIGTAGDKGLTVYGGSKAAVIGISQSLAKELAAQNIRVNAIAPGFIDTDLASQLSPEKYQERLDSIGMQRIGKAMDIANTALFLASDLSTYVTGQVIGVDGGMLI